MGNVIGAEISTMIDTAFRDLYAATKEYQAQELRYLELASDLEQQEYTALAGGLVTGKNEAERKANLYALFEDMNALVTSANIRKTAAQHEMVLAQLELDRLLKVAELGG